MRHSCLLALWLTACTLSAAVSAPARAQSPAFDQWRQADAATQQAALALARRAFDAYALRRDVIAPPAGLPPCFSARAAVFVSAMRNGAPRCCMGTLYPTQPTAALEIINAAVAAAGRDHRFAPIRPGELAGLRLIVSVLSPPRPLGTNQLPGLDPVSDGLVVQNGDRSGVVLSGETARVSTMLTWGRTRAGATAASRVQLFRIQSVRFVEPTHAPAPRAADLPQACTDDETICSVVAMRLPHRKNTRTTLCRRLGRLETHRNRP